MLDMEWISVNDRLPETGSNVLVFAKKYEGDVCNKVNREGIYKVGWKSVDYCIVDDTDYYEARCSEITHWMPLPKPPIV